MRSYNVYLASSSPRRAELIKKIPWLNATVFPSDAVEYPYSGGDPERYAMALAYLKATDVFKKTGGVVIGADTVVYAEGEVLGKPRDAHEAREMLKTLCECVLHEVITGYCVVSDEKIVKNFVKTYVTFGAFDEKIVYNYINSGSPFDKAGGYGLQDPLIAPLITEVRGDRDNVIGLPVEAVEKTLKEFI